MADKLFIEVVTPEKAVLTGSADEVVLPGSEGQMGILPGHLPLLSSLDVGEMIVRGLEGENRRFFVDGGFVEVLPDKVTVMTELCDGYDSIDVSSAKVAIEDAEKELLAVQERSQSEEVEADVLAHHQDALRRARMRLAFTEEGDE